MLARCQVSDANDVLRRLDAELSAGAEVTIVKQGENVIVTVTGGTQLVGGCMAAGDTAHDALVVAFDMDCEDDDE